MASAIELEVQGGQWAPQNYKIDNVVFDLWSQNFCIPVVSLENKNGYIREDKQISIL